MANALNEKINQAIKDYESLRLSDGATVMVGLSLSDLNNLKEFLKSEDYEEQYVAFKTVKQSIMEINHVHKQGAAWFTRGETGAWQHADNWIKKAQEAFKVLHPPTFRPVTNVDINAIEIGSTITHADGRRGVVYQICEKVIDGINQPSTAGILASVRLFITYKDTGESYDTYRQDGRSKNFANNDIVSILSCLETYTEM